MSAQCWTPVHRGDEELWWRELQLAAPASADVSVGECTPNSELFFNRAVLSIDFFSSL
jgi:hypothetical protein